MDTLEPTPAVITVVHSPACHFCDDAQAALAVLGRELALSVELIGASEPRGAALLAAHRAGMFPLVLVAGQFFSVGRLPRKKLRKLLDARLPAAA